MAVPDFQSMMLPILEFMSGAQEKSAEEVKDFIAQKFDLTEEEKAERTASNSIARYHSNALWAVTYLRKAKILENVSRGIYKITERGQSLLKECPPKINIKLLKRYEEIQEFIASDKLSNNSASEDLEKHDNDFLDNPEEIISKTHTKIIDSLADELLVQLKNITPYFFEKIVVDVLLKIGYGGIHGRGMVVGKSGDGGIDGIIYEDKLGLESIYIQAKKWEGNVPDREIRDFIGSLDLKGARKGIFITTSEFTKPALESAEKARNVRIVLIDGKTLAKVMIDYNIGISTRTTYEIKRIDSDYFEE